MDKNDLERITTVDQIPDDPLRMPPPFWRSNGAIFHIIDALEDMNSLLLDLIPLHAETNMRLADYYQKYPELKDDDEDALEEFSEITEDLGNHEHLISLKAEIALATRHWTIVLLNESRGYFRC